MRGSKKRKVTIGAVIVTLVLVILFVVLQVPRRVRLLFPTEKTIEQDVKKYLKKRYKQDFHVTNIIPPSYEYASYIITVYPYGKPMDEEHKATVQGWEKDGLITYYDNYALVKLIPEFKEYISEIVKEEFPENKVYVRIYGPEWYRENLDKYISFDGYLKQSKWKKNNLLEIDINRDEISNESFEMGVNKIVKRMARDGICGEVYFYLLNDGKKFQNLPDVLTSNVDIGEFGKDFIDIYCYIYNKEKIKLRLEEK